MRFTLTAVLCALMSLPALASAQTRTETPTAVPTTQERAPDTTEPSPTDARPATCEVTVAVPDDATDDQGRVSLNGHRWTHVAVSHRAGRSAPADEGTSDDIVESLQTLDRNDDGWLDADELEGHVDNGGGGTSITFTLNSGDYCPSVQ